MQVESRITEVALYARGARVRRAATVALTGSRIAGKLELVGGNRRET